MCKIIASALTLDILIHHYYTEGALVIFEKVWFFKVVWQEYKISKQQKQVEIIY